MKSLSRKQVQGLANLYDYDSRTICEGVLNKPYLIWSALKQRDDEEQGVQVLTD